jgi:hypothetical protein
MNNDDVERMLGGIKPPRPSQPMHQDELKIPLLRYRQSSKAGLWLLVFPAIAAVTTLLKHELALSSPLVDGLRRGIAAVDGNPVLTFLVPITFIGLPCAAMIMNLLACSHVAVARERREALITIKYRPANILVFLLSFAMLVFFLLPDAMSF